MKGRGDEKKELSKDECQTYQGNACESEGCSRPVTHLCQYRKKWSRDMKPIKFKPLLMPLRHMIYSMRKKMETFKP
ncbi:hypothetical protein B4073_0338 [Bacillus subtilis]|uniref:Uncharacterized protein n=1 Tax=Bacillus subtilis subsp. subtilis TaxID=135461 RepID=A0ABD3ZMJ1_BACIU|nr:hypothetical protein B4067_0390 [Bacillus subtilis subsp. subtilis]KIN45065.1 hypothetical protein B4073_0338 [Bacillus subtilis]